MTPIALIRRRLSSKTNQAPEPSAEVEISSSPSQIAPPQRTSTIFNEELKYVINPQKQKSLLLSKIEFCSERVSFYSNDQDDVKQKENKRRILLELVEYLSGLNQTHNGNVQRNKASAGFPDDVLKAMIHMIEQNLFVDVFSNSEDFDPEEDEPLQDPKWPHKQVVLEFLLRLIVSPELNPKIAKKQGLIDQDFILSLLQLFESEDTRERDYLKSILHRLYGKFFTHRKFIRDKISQTFTRFVNCQIQHHGIAELLEILGSIINGFSLPLKKEHLNFLQKSLMPLHISKYYSQYQQQLNYCIMQFIEKDKTTAATIIIELVQVWPWRNSQKQVLFLQTIEEILVNIHPLDDKMIPILESIVDTFFVHMATLMVDDHFQVAERALWLWTNPKISSNGLLGFIFAEKSFPIIYPKIAQNMGSETSEGHWNPTVVTLSEKVLAMYKQALSEDAFNEIVERIEKEETEEEKDRRLAQRISTLLAQMEVPKLAS